MQEGLVIGLGDKDETVIVTTREPRASRLLYHVERRHPRAGGLPAGAHLSMSWKAFFMSCSFPGSRQQNLKCFVRMARKCHSSGQKTWYS